LIILGIKYPGHDSAATLLIDGNVIAASSQARFDRVKHSRAFPVDAVKWCLEHANITINDVDAVAVPYNFRDAFFRYFPKLLIKFGHNVFKAFGQSLYDDVSKYLRCRVGIRKQCSFKGDVYFLDHHDCHAASSFYTSPFENAAIVSVDGRGECSTTKLYTASINGIKHIASIGFPHSLGFVYSKITSYLGFRCDCDEGKVMGFAPYGDDRFTNKFRQIIALNPDFGFNIDLEYFDYHKDICSDVSKKFVYEFGPRRSRNEELTKCHAAVAYALQHRLEESMEHLIRKAHELTNLSNLCIAGGVGLNAVANGKLYEKQIFDNIYIQPAAGDDGSTLGSALLLYYRLTKERYSPKPYWSPYLGYEALPNEIDYAVATSRLNCKTVTNIEERVAQLLAEGKVVGWYQGRAEFGPRALGSRSILAAPNPAYMKDRVNHIKKREPFRPFAPAVLCEDMHKYFSFYRDSPYMTFAFPVKTGVQGSLAAVVHNDGTARVQTVTAKQNKMFYGLIRHFRAISGHGVVLNVSFRQGCMT